MWQALLLFFKGAKFINLSKSLSLLSPILSELESNYSQDKDAKNALIDTLVQILQNHKE